MRLPPKLVKSLGSHPLDTRGTILFRGSMSDLCMVILYLDLPKKYRLKPLSKQSDDKYAWLLTK